MEGDTFRVAEWNIENFSCWNLDLHGNCIQYDVPFLEDVKFILYPRGVGGNGDCVVVRVCFSSFTSCSGDLSFISSDGTTMCTQRVIATEDKLDVMLPTGPRFKEVLARIGKVEAGGDRITVLYKSKSARDHTEKMCTVIDVFNKTLKVKPTVFFIGDREIPLLNYNTTDNNKILYLVSVRKGSKTKLKLFPPALNDKKRLFRSSVSVVKRDGKIERCIETEHVCADENPWTILKALDMREMDRRDMMLHLHIKIIIGTTTSARYCHNKFSPAGTSTVPNRACSSKKVSPKSLDSVKNGDNSVEELTKDFTRLFQDQGFSDITLKCGDVSFAVHKNILSERSPVFEAMFSTYTKEAGSGTVDIGDLDPSTLSRFLTYLYTGAVRDLQCDRAFDLYYAANKYQVSSLQKECVDFFEAKISASNVCDILSLAHRHSDDRLAAVSHKFILNNYRD